MAGIYDPDDPLVQEWKQAMAAYRQQVEDDPDYPWIRLGLGKKDQHMNAVRTIQSVTGPSLTIPMPPEFAGKQVEVIVLPVEPTQSLPPKLDARYAPYLMAKPILTEEDKKLLAENPYPLRGTGGEYTEPFEPAVPLEDWEVYRKGSEGDAP